MVRNIVICCCIVILMTDVMINLRNSVVLLGVNESLISNHQLYIFLIFDLFYKCNFFDFGY